MVSSVRGATAPLSDRRRAARPSLPFSTARASGKAHLLAYPRASWPSAAPSSAGNASLPSRVARAVENGKLGRAARLLSDNGAVAPLTEDTIQALRTKHPEGADNPFGARKGNAPSSLPELELLLSSFATFKPDTAPGVSGWTPSLLGHALKSNDVQAFLLLLTKQVAGGTAPGRELLCTSRLTPLVKPDGGIRPIACGELIWRLISRTLVRHYSSRSMLLPWQFGVGTKGGVEPVTRALELALSGDLPRPYTHVTSLDFSNAFNALSRSALAAGLLEHAPALFRAGKWAYNKPSQLIVLGEDRESVVILSSNGVRQGDPLGPLFFSIGARNVLANLAAELGDKHRNLTQRLPPPRLSRKQTPKLPAEPHPQILHLDDLARPAALLPRLSVMLMPSKRSRLPTSMRKH